MDQKKELDELIQNEQQFRILVENLNGLLFSINNEGLIIYVSPYVFELTGYTPDEVIGRPFADFIYPDDLMPVLKNFKKNIQGNLGSFEYRLNKKDNGFVWVRSYSQLIGTPDKPEGLSGLMVDITENKNTEEALRESQLSMSTIFNTINDFLFVLDSRGKILQINRIVLKKLGYMENELIGNSFLKVHPPELKDEAVAVLTEIQLGKSSICSIPLQCKDGKLIPVETRVTHGELLGEKVLFGVSRDITDRLLAEKELRVKTEELDKFFLNAADLLCVADTKGYFRRLNTAWENTLGYKLEELEGKCFLDFVHPDDIQQTLKALNQISNQKVILNFVNRYRCKDNSYKWLEWRSYPSGDICYAAARDITEQLNYEKERENLINKLEVKNVELERFIYTVSHDLKTPLLTVKGFITILEDNLASKTTEHFQLYFDRIKTSADKMMNFIEDLLEFSKIVQVEDNAIEIPFENIVREAVDLCSWQIEKDNIKVIIIPSLPVVYGDPKKLVQVLQNLLNNAIKFRRKNSKQVIEIGVRDENQEPVFYVRDNGIGLNSQDREKIFDLFIKLDAKSEGTGIGLTIVKRIIELHRGRVWVESKGKNKGVTICFTIPLKRK